MTYESTLFSGLAGYSLRLFWRRKSSLHTIAIFILFDGGTFGQLPVRTFQRRGILERCHCENNKGQQK